MVPALRRSASSASAIPGYWILTATCAPVEQLGAVHLADRGGGEGLLLELGEELGERLAVVLLLQHLLDLLPGHRRRVVRSLRELLLVDLAVLVGDELGVDEGGELAELHRRALHLAERADHLHRRLQVALLELLLARPPRSGRRWSPWSRRSGRPARRRSSPAWPSGGSCPWGSSSRRPRLKVATGALARRFLYPLPSDGKHTRKAEGRSPRGVRLPQLPPPARRGPGARRRLCRRRRGDAPSRSANARCAPCSPAARRSSTSSWRARKPCRSWSRSSSCTRCAATSSTSTCRR